MACGIRHVLVNTYNGAWFSDVTPQKVQIVFFNLYMSCINVYCVPFCTSMWWCISPTSWCFVQPLHHVLPLRFCRIFLRGGRDRGKRFRGTSTGAGSKGSLSRESFVKEAFFLRNLKGPSLSCKGLGWFGPIFVILKVLGNQKTISEILWKSSRLLKTNAYKNIVQLWREWMNW